MKQHESVSELKFKNKMKRKPEEKNEKSSIQTAVVEKINSRMAPSNSVRQFPKFNLDLKFLANAGN